MLGGHTDFKWAMPKQIRLNAFEMNCVVHQSPGLWRHPRDRSRDYRHIGGWIELARTLERGLFDGLFLAVQQGEPQVALPGEGPADRRAVPVPDDRQSADGADR